MNLTRTRTLALGGAIFVTTAVAALAVPLVAAANSDGRRGGVEVEVASADVPSADAAPDTPAAPDTTVPTRAAPASAAPAAPPTTARTRAAAHATAPPTESAPAPSAPAAAAPAAAAPKLAPGQRLNPTSAQVHAAIATLHQRIPLFEPTQAQLRTFADAVCSSLDQGPSRAQVEATVRDAVSRIQGASLTAADASFAVGLMIELRCPGYLP